MDETMTTDNAITAADMTKMYDGQESDIEIVEPKPLTLDEARAVFGNE